MAGVEVAASNGSVWRLADRRGMAGAKRLGSSRCGIYRPGKELMARNGRHEQVRSGP